MRNIYIPQRFLLLLRRSILNNDHFRSRFFLKMFNRFTALSNYKTDLGPGYHDLHKTRVSHHRSGSAVATAAAASAHTHIANSLRSASLIHNRQHLLLGSTVTYRSYGTCDKTFMFFIFFFIFEFFLSSGIKRTIKLEI